MHNIQYLRYVLAHKWFVFKACLLWRSPLLVWRGIIHDWQKLTPSEWVPYVDSFYRYDYDTRPDTVVEAFDRAWLHHQHLGPHHWQYWVLREVDGGTKALRMPDSYVKEMISDWIGAGLAINGHSETLSWYRKNKGNMILHPDTKGEVESLLSRLNSGGIIN